MFYILIPALFFFIFVIGWFNFAEAAINNYDFFYESEDEEDKPELEEEELINKVYHDREILAATNEILNTISFSMSVLSAVFIGYLYNISNQPISDPLSQKSILTIFALTISVCTLYWLFGLLIPRSFGEKFSQKSAHAAARFMLFWLMIARAPIYALVAIANLFTQPFGAKTRFSTFKISEGKIRELLQESLEAGTINATEHEIMENVFEFSDMKIREIMLPRTEMEAVELTDNPEKDFKSIIKIGHSIIPVYEESLDHIIGVVRTKDLLLHYFETGVYEIKALIKTPYIVPETKGVSQLLRDLQKRGEQMAIVTDEYGGTEGIITIEDVLSEIVGNFAPNTKDHEADYVALPDGRFLVLGAMSISDFNEVLNCELPESEEYSTVAGFIGAETGKILTQGDKFIYEEIQFELIKKVRQKMVRFMVSRIAKVLSEE